MPLNGKKEMKWEHQAYFFLSYKPSRIIIALINVLFGKLLEHLLCSLLHGMGMSKETREQILKTELPCAGSTTFSYTNFPTQTCEQALGGGRCLGCLSLVDFGGI